MSRDIFGFHAWERQDVNGIRAKRPGMLLKSLCLQDSSLQQRVSSAMVSSVCPMLGARLQVCQMLTWCYNSKTALQTVCKLIISTINWHASCVSEPLFLHIHLLIRDHCQLMLLKLHSKGPKKATMWESEVIWPRPHKPVAGENFSHNRNGKRAEFVWT